MRKISLLLVGALLAGCAGRAEFHPFGGNKEEAAQLAAFAAQSQYPTQSPTMFGGTALISHDRGAIQILNPTNDIIQNAKVWVNGIYVAKVDSIPAHGTVSLNRDRFYDKAGNNLASTKADATKLELQTSSGFFSLQGPVYQ